jgi:mRNA interferase RelE/StbE
VTKYTIYVSPAALHDIKDLPGNMRQRVRRAISDLATNPRPNDSKDLALPDTIFVDTQESTRTTANIPNSAPFEVRRLRIDRWRIIYFVHDIDELIDVVAVRKRPPYDYGDLAQLLTDQ